MTDPDFLATARRAGIDIEPTAGADVQRLVARILAAPANVIDKAKRFAERP
jgi:hypothetical protein